MYVFIPDAKKHPFAVCSTATDPPSGLLQLDTRGPIACCVLDGMSFRVRNVLLTLLKCTEDPCFDLLFWAIMVYIVNTDVFNI